MNMNRKQPKKKHNRKPLVNAFFNLSELFCESASATTGVIAAENPIPIDIAINKKLFPRDTAARLSGSNFPTMMLSTIPTIV
tara:strand:- start:7811 stop:8056 length:246 start_codon:yes stop_codon:yes gene_type:complete